MKKYKCTICGYVYDEEKEGTKFEDLPDTWVCPMCGVGKEMFEEVLKEDAATIDRAQKAINAAPSNSETPNETNINNNNTTQNKEHKVQKKEPYVNITNTDDSPTFFINQ